MPPAAAPHDVLDFWFSDATRKHWFARSDEFDGRVREVLGPLYERAARGELDGWADDLHGALALVLLLDQVPRNLHRGSAAAFACDAAAVRHARAVVDAGLDRKLGDSERVFLYLPFEHSESMEDQDRSVALMSDFAEPMWRDYAVRHRDIVARFGRFPHRNVALGRESTAEELAFLEQPGSSF